MEFGFRSFGFLESELVGIDFELGVYGVVVVSRGWIRVLGRCFVFFFRGYVVRILFCLGCVCFFYYII